MYKYFLVIILLLSKVIVANAEPVIVSILGSYDVAKIELEEGKKAAIKVFLQSFGEELAGYYVSLFRDSDQKEIKRLKSNALGELLFDGISPGSYTVAIIKPKQQTLRQSMVKVGDVRISVSTKEQQ